MTTPTPNSPFLQLTSPPISLPLPSSLLPFHFLFCPESSELLFSPSDLSFPSARVHFASEQHTKQCLPITRCQRYRDKRVRIPYMEQLAGETRALQNEEAQGAVGSLRSKQ